MPVYSYKAVDQNGIIVSNKIQEKSKQGLIKRLKAGGLTPIEVSQTKLSKYSRDRKTASNIDELMNIASEIQGKAQEKKRKFSTKERVSMFINQSEKITNRDIIIFTENFYLLKKAGFNNVHALSTLITSTENSSLRGILEDVLAGVEGGDYMYTTLEYYTDIFPYIYVNLIKVGELSGSLEESLHEAVKYMESSTALTKKIKGILIPNIAQFVVLFVILIVASVVLIPVIQNVFETVGSSEKLPKITIWFSNFLTGMQKVWFIPVLIIAGIIGYIYLKTRTPKGKYKWDYFLFTMPLFGKLIFSINFSRLSNAMLLNLKNGMRIQEALEVSKNVVSNLVLRSLVESSINNIIIGESWVKPFEESGLTSTMITEMLKIGMQTDLPQMMEKLVEYMNIDIDNNIQKIVKVLPELMYTFIGILIVFIAVVVLVPCIQIYMGSFLFSAAGV